LEPLGNLCLCNAKIIGVWGAFLGGWIILSTIYKFIGPYVPYFTLMLFVLLAVATISFFLPLWGVHLVMLEKKAVL